MFRWGERAVAAIHRASQGLRDRRAWDSTTGRERDWWDNGLGAGMNLGCSRGCQEASWRSGVEGGAGSLRRAFQDLVGFPFLWQVQCGTIRKL